MPKYNIKHVPIDKLKVNPDNPRLIKDTAFNRLVKSLEDCPELFEARPCICSDRTGELVIIGGNMRYQAARELKYEKVPAIAITGLTAEQEREIILAIKHDEPLDQIREVIDRAGGLPKIAREKPWIFDFTVKNPYPGYDK